MARLPDFVVIGAMKCGTSSLHTALSKRSGIHMSTPKEPNFFSDDAEYAKGLASYARCFEGASDGQIVGESSTHYTKLPTHPRALERLAEALPDARFVYCVRHPVDRIVSQVRHELSRGEVEGEPDRIVLEHERFVAYSQYHRQVAPYVERFGEASVLLVGLERLQRDPVQELARIGRFLGDPTPETPRAEDLVRVNAGDDRMQESALRDRLKLLPVLGSLFRRLPEPVKELVRRPWRVPQPDLSPDVRAELERRVDPDLAALGARVGRPLSCATWHRQTQTPLDWVSPEPEAGPS